MPEEINTNSVQKFFASLTVQKILPVVLIIVVGIIVVKLLMKLFNKILEKSKLNRTMFSFLRATMRIILYALVVLIAAGSLGIDVSSLVAVLSILSLAISLAVQNTLSNLVGGFSLLTTHPFQVGDFIQVGPDSGTVEEITMTYTRILTPDGKHIYIPNNDVASARIYNYSDEGKRRVDITVTASYEDSIDDVKAALLKAADHDKRLKDTEIEVYVNSYQDSAVEYLVRLWTTAQDYFTVKFDVTEAIKREFDSRGITIPFPQMEVQVKK